MIQRPRFRTDLVAKPVNEAGQRFVDVTDPDSGSTFRFYEVEYAVACAMDGQRDVGSLLAWSKAELGLEPSPDEVETVVSTLDELGYLSADAGSDGMDVELGAPGKSPIAEDRPAVDSGLEVELGNAGGGIGDDTQVTDISGVPGGDEVSVDLSQHLSIGKDDVKEAVRQSRVMGAVEAPEDDDDEAPTEVKSEPVAPAEVKKPAEAAKPITIPAKPPAKKPSPAEQAAAALPKPEGEAVEKPSGGGAMTFVLIILLLGVLAVGGWFVYTNFLQKGDASSQAEPPAPTAPQAPAKKKLPSRLS